MKPWDLGNGKTFDTSKFEWPLKWGTFENDVVRVSEGIAASRGRSSTINGLGVHCNVLPNHNVTSGFRG